MNPKDLTDIKSVSLMNPSFLKILSHWKNQIQNSSDSQKGMDFIDEKFWLSRTQELIFQLNRRSTNSHLTWFDLSNGGGEKEKRIHVWLLKPIKSEKSRPTANFGSVWVSFFKSMWISHCEKSEQIRRNTVHSDELQ